MVSPTQLLEKRSILARRMLPVVHLEPDWQLEFVSGCIVGDIHGASATASSVSTPSPMRLNKHKVSLFLHRRCLGSRSVFPECGK